MKEAIKTKQYEYTGVSLPRPLKQEVRLIAAGMETSIGKAAMRLIELGIKEYKRQITAASEGVPDGYPITLNALPCQRIMEGGKA
jgi:hypothetical protein